MRLNKLGLCTLALLLSILFLFCGDRERSDIITGAGGGVVTDMDSTLTNMGKGFILKSLGAEKTDSVFSIPGDADVNFSTQGASWFMAGVNTQGDTLRASFQFRALNGASRYSSEDKLDGAYLYFRALGSDTSASSGAVGVFTSNPLKEITPITGAADGTNEKIGDFTLGRIDSLKLDDALAKSIFDTRTSKSADTLSFAFSILDYDKSIRKINNPYVILRVIRASNSSVVRDSIITAFTFFTAFENEAKIAERAKSPYSSQNTLRTAVFRIDISEIITAAKSAEIINATLSVFIKDDETIAGDQYKIVVLDELLADNDSLAGVLQRHFINTAASRLNKNGNVHSIKTIARNTADKPNSKYIYAYLRPTSDHSVIMWDKASLKVEAVLTPTRTSR